MTIEEQRGNQLRDLISLIGTDLVPGFMQRCTALLELFGTKLAVARPENDDRLHEGLFYALSSLVTVAKKQALKSYEQHSTGYGRVERLRNVAAFSELLVASPDELITYLGSLRKLEAIVQASMSSAPRLARQHRARLWLTQPRSDKTVRRHSQEWDYGKPEPQFAAATLDELITYLSDNSRRDELRRTFQMTLSIDEQSSAFSAMNRGAIQLSTEKPTNATLQMPLIHLADSDLGAEVHIDRDTKASLAATDLVGYIHRQELEERFAKLVASGERLIAFVGLPGMGKTTLATAVTKRRSNGSHVPIIPFEPGGGPSPTNLRSALRASRIEAVGSAQDQLIDLLCHSERAPEFVVLDNFHDTGELARHVPLHTKSIVVATCRMRAQVEQSTCRVISVDAMNEHEARKLIQYRLPHINFDAASKLAVAAYAYPLLIEIICGLARHGNWTIADLSSLSSDDLASIVDSRLLPGGSTLGMALDTACESIRSQDSVALEALLICSCNRWHQSYTSYSDIENFLSEGSPTPSIRLQVARAEEILIALSLVRREEYGLSMHPFIRECLRRQRADEVVELFGRLCRMDWSKFEWHVESDILGWDAVADAFAAGGQLQIDEAIKDRLSSQIEHLIWLRSYHRMNASVHRSRCKQLSDFNDGLRVGESVPAQLISVIAICRKEFGADPIL